MPVIKSAIKKMRQDVKRRRINRGKKEQLKELIKTARKQPTEKNVRSAISLVDKIAKKGLIHKKKAGHLKSSLSKFLTKGAVKTGAVKKKKGAAGKKIKTQNPRKPKAGKSLKKS